MDEAKTQKRHAETCGVEASRVGKEFNAASSVEHDNTNHLSIVFGGKQATVEKRTDKLHQSSVILDTIQSLHAPSTGKQRTYWRYSICGKG